MVAILHPTGPGSQIQIDRAVVLIGRSPECDVVLDFSSKISRMHCALVQVDAAYFVRDLGSMNGVTVAGQRVEKDQQLTNGVEVMIGDVKYLFLENVLPAPKVARPTAGVRATPVLIDETVDVLDVEEVEIIEPTVVRRTTANPSPPINRPTLQSRPGSGSGRLAKQRPEIVDDVEVVDAYVIEDMEIVEDVEVCDDVIDVVEDVEIIEEVEVLEDVEIVDVEVIEDSPRRPRRPPRLR